MKITWSRQASEEVAAIRDSRSRHSPDYFRKLAQRVFNRVEILEKHPLAGSEVEQYANDTIRELYEKPYRILYRVTDDEVEIVNVIHHSKPLPRTPPG